MAVAFVAFMSLPFYIGGGRVGSLSVLPLYGWCILFMMPVIFVGGLALLYLRSRPLGIGDEGIATFIFGRKWKFIDWPHVTKVERFRIYDSFFYTYRHVFLVYSNGARIRFDDWIDKLPTIIATLNVYIARYRIPAFSIDRGRNALHRNSSLVIDSSTRNGLTHDDGRTSVTEL